MSFQKSNSVMMLCVRVISGFLFAVFIQSAAQAADEQIEPQKESEVERIESADALHLFNLMIRPEASLSAVYDSNIFATRNDELSDLIKVFQARLKAESDWQSHQLGFDMGGTIGIYDKYNNEDYEDYWGRVNTQIDVSDKANLFGGLGYAVDHEERGSPRSDLVGSGPTTFKSRNAHAGIALTGEKLGLRTGGTIEQLRYDNTLPITNEDRNRDILGFGARLSYRLNSHYTVYVQGISDVRDYSIEFDDNGFRRDSRGHRADVGFLATPSDQIKAELYVGHLLQRYDDSRFNNVNTVGFGGSIQYRYSPRTIWSAQLDRTLEETTISGASGYLYSTVSGKVEHMVTPRITVSAAVSASEADYQEISRKDRYYAAMMGARYYPTANLFVGAEYRVQVRDSNITQTVNNDANIQFSDDYSRSQAFLTIGALLHPVNTGPMWDAPSGEPITGTDGRWTGFYAGIQTAHEALSLLTSSTRGSNTDQGEFADSKLNIGLFAGGGYTFENSLYLGIEVEGDRSNTKISHSKSKLTSHTQYVTRQDSFGGSVRVGYQIPTGALLYTRVGLVRTQFDTYVTINNAPENAFINGSYINGMRYGLGMEIPLLYSMFARFDYTHTKYDTILANLVTHVESFDLREDMFRFGLGWQFGAGETEPATTAIDVAGPYVGLQLGHGSLRSVLTGTHNESGIPPSTFAGDFGGDVGATAGVYLGYGYVFQEYLYIGVEAELEGSSSRWLHNRFPSGRNFSVDKKETWGGTLRVGYAFENGTLLYGRLGGAHTRFNTLWRKGGNRLNDVDRDDRELGIRYGLGAEVPITVSSFLRLDYTFTDYGSYSFTTSHANQDTMQFHNKETLARIGMGLRF